MLPTTQTGLHNLCIPVLLALKNVYITSAAAYIKINDLQKALADCQQAVAIKPDFARAHGRMG